jgi:nucleoside-diphosphate-sugar epimerase
MPSLEAFVNDPLTAANAQANAVLVTGANGFVGRAVCTALLSLKIPVIGFDRIFDEESPLDSTHRVVGDITDPSTVRTLFSAHRITHVVHGGGISGPAVAHGRPGLIHAVNVSGTINLLEVALRHRVTRFLLLSSIAAYGNHPALETVPEDTPLLATDYYGASKAASETVARSFREHAGLDIIALRLASIYGPGRRVPCIVGGLFASAQSGQPAIVSAAARNPRQLIYIDDCVDAIMSSLAAPPRPLFAYNIATGQCISEYEVASEAAEIDKRVRFTISDEEKYFDSRLGPLSVDAARRDLGFEARTGLREGLRRYWSVRQASQHAIH